MDFDIVSIVAPKVSEWEIVGNQIIEARFKNADNPSRFFDIASMIKCEIIPEDDSIKLHINKNEYEEYRESMVARAANKNSFDKRNYSPEDINAINDEVQSIISEAQIIIKDMFREEINACVLESKQEIAENAKKQIAPTFTSILGGS